MKNTKDKALELSASDDYFDNIVEGEALEIFNPQFLDKQHPKIRDLITYFWGKSENKDRPKRKLLVPSEILPLIPCISILEPRYDGENLMDISIRLMGTEMVKVYGELTGKMVSDVMDYQVAKRIMDTCDLVIKSKSIVVGTVSSFDKEKSFLKLLKVKIPLFDDEHKPDRVTQIISLIVFSS